MRQLQVESQTNFITLLESHLTMRGSTLNDNENQNPHMDESATGLSHKKIKDKK